MENEKELTDFITRTLYAWNMADPNNHHLENRLHVLNSEAQDIAEKLAPAIIAAGYIKPTPVTNLEGEIEKIITRACLHFTKGDQEQIHCAVLELKGLIQSAIQTALDKRAEGMKREI
jgi:hypothetical protein